MRTSQNPNTGRGCLARSLVSPSSPDFSASPAHDSDASMSRSTARATCTRWCWQLGCGPTTTETVCHRTLSVSPTSCRHLVSWSARATARGGALRGGGISPPPTAATRLFRRALARQTRTPSSSDARFTVTWDSLTAQFSMEFVGFESDHASDERPNPPAPVNAPIARRFQSGHSWRRVTEQRR